MGAPAGKVGTGRILARALPRKEEVDGFALPDTEANEWAEVVQVGPLSKQVYYWWELMWYRLFPPIRPGDMVLIPKMAGRGFSIGEQRYYIFYQHEVEYWQKPGDDSPGRE